MTSINIPNKKMLKSLFKRNASQNEKETSKQRRAAIVPQHFDYDEDLIKTITKHPKTKEDEMFIRSAFENNDFLSSLVQEEKIQDIIDCMYPEEVNPGQIIIKQGDQDGSHLYVSIKGSYDVIQNEKVINTFSDVRVFGELALLYNAKRLATIKAKTFGKLWILDRLVFKYLMVRSDIEQHEEIVSFLEQVPKLNSVNREVLEEVANLITLEFYVTGTKIIEEGDTNTDKFYIIRAGSVTVSKNNQPIDKLYKGNFFGELALLKDNERKATVTADPPGTECLILTRQTFIEHFGNIPDCFSINIQAQPYKPIEEIIEHTDLNFNDFNSLGTIGVGTFGRVELVQHNFKKELVFALKHIKKHVIAQLKNWNHVFNEKNIQITCKSKFIVRLYRTYKDSKYLYFLLEPCLGGDLWTHLYKQNPCKFEEKDAKFYAGCVLEGFTYLHERHIIYRDLKPENLLIDALGYIKLTDFGFAKKLDPNVKKTYTFTGTPEYIAPEFILNRGHDKGVDYWALGIFIFELLTGTTPFRNDDPSCMTTYKLILKGIDDITFPKHISFQAENLIKRLCKITPSQRLGCSNCGIEEIKVHKWFVDLDWDKLMERTIPAPFKPNLRNNVDTHYFEKFSKDDTIPPDENADWDQDF